MRLAADANVLLAAVLGQAAARVFDHSVEVVTTANVLAEVEEYLPHVAKKVHVDVETAQGGFRLLKLKIRVLSESSYATHLAEAARRVEKIDPDDVNLLALALALEVPVWSNDNDFKGTGVEWYTTARLLTKLGIFSK